MGISEEKKHFQDLGLDGSSRNISHFRLVQRLKMSRGTPLFPLYVQGMDREKIYFLSG